MTLLPKISIVSACYNLVEANRLESFRRAVTSMKAQDHPETEHIVVDGASTDGTLDMLNALLDEGKIGRLISEPDQGLYDAINKGSFAATGDYIGVLHSDDFFHNPKGLSFVAQEVARSQPDFLASPVIHARKGGDKFMKISRGYRRLLLTMPFAHPGILIRREVFEALGGYSLDFPIAADYDLILRMLRAGYRGANLLESFVTFSDGGVSSVRADRDRDHARVWERNFWEFQPLDFAGWLEAARTDVLPLEVSRAILADRSVSSVWRSSARLQFWRTLLKGWRS